MGLMNEARQIVGAGTPAAAWRADPALAAVPTATLDELVPPGWRAVLVAPHPDDEVLAWGGLLQLLAARSAPLLLVAVTDGEASHPGSCAWPAARLRQQRPSETVAALDALGLSAVTMARLRLADGGVTAALQDLSCAIAALLRPNDVVITTWRQDGHPDHEATAHACATAAALCEARLLQTPVWGWHWNAPDRNAMPFGCARRLVLTPAQLARKAAALACFASQLKGDPASGVAPILPPHVLERALLDCEVFL